MVGPLQDRELPDSQITSQLGFSTKTKHLSYPLDSDKRNSLLQENWGLSAGTGKLCIFGHLGLVFIWSCLVSCLLLLLYYVICAPVLTEGTENCLFNQKYTKVEAPIFTGGRHSVEEEE